MNEWYVGRSTGVAARMIGDELMIMSGRDSSLFSLNETASLLWQSADGATALSEIARQISASYEVDADTALRDARETAEALAEHGILLLSDAPIADVAPPAKGAR